MKVGPGPDDGAEFTLLQLSVNFMGDMYATSPDYVTHWGTQLHRNQNYTWTFVGPNIGKVKRIQVYVAPYGNCSEEIDYLSWTSLNIATFSSKNLPTYYYETGEGKIYGGNHFYYQAGVEEFSSMVTLQPHSDCTSTVKTDTFTRNCNHVIDAEVQSSFECTACHLLVQAAHEVIGLSATTAKDYMSTICDDLLLLAPFCKNIFGGVLKQIVAAIKSGLSSETICTTVVHSCSNIRLNAMENQTEDQCGPDSSVYAAELRVLTMAMNEPRLAAPPARMTIVEQVQPRNAILEEVFNINRLHELFHTGGSDRQQKENALKFMAQYGLIRNTMNCNNAAKGCANTPSSLVFDKTVGDGFFVSV